MAASTGPNLGLSYGWTPRNGGIPGDSGWGDPVSANFKKMDALLGLSVLSAAAAAPAITTDGTRYIVPAAGATGAFAGKANQVAVRVAGVWEFHVPARGWLAENQAGGNVMKFNGTTWVDVEVAQPYLDVSNPGANTLVNGASFTQIQLYTKNEDTANSWNGTTYKYTPAVSGLYLVEAMVRPVRTGTNPMGTGVNLKLGFGSAAADGIDVECDTSTDLLPFTLTFCKPMRLVAGTAYFLFGNHTSATPVAFTYAQLKLTRLGL
jgi:hypothetical protein